MTPTHLIELLASFRTRLRRLTALYGLGVVLLVVGGVLVGIALFDWMFHLSKVWRLLMAVGGLTLIVSSVVRYLVRPLASRLPVTDIAGRIEHLFPQFQDRLRSAVGFIQHPQRTDANESAAMRQATVDQAINLASALPLHQVIDPKPAFRIAGGGLALSVALLATVALLPQATRSILLSRVFNPLSSVQWPKRYAIEMANPIAKRVPFGGRIDVSMRLARGDGGSARPILFYETEGGGVRQEFLTRGDDGRYSTSIDARAESLAGGGAMKVWIVAGDDQTTPQRIEVVPRLAVAAMTAKVTPPAYVKNPTVNTYDLTNPQAAGLIGSNVEFVVAFNKPLASVDTIKLLPSGEGSIAPQLTWSMIDERTARGTARLDKSLHFRVDAQDQDGFAAAASRDFDLLAVADLLPTITIENPRGDERRTPEAVVPLAAQANDDGGVRELSLVVRRLVGNASDQTWTLPFIVDGNLVADANASAIGWQPLSDPAGGQRNRLSYDWTLATVKLGEKLKPGDVIEYWLRVTDNYELDGQRHPPVDSEKLKITFISQEQLVGQITDELRQVRTQIEAVKGTQDQTTGETESFKSDTANKPELDAADASVANRLQQQQGSAASAAKALAERLNGVQKSLQENRSPSTELGQMSKAVADRLTQTAEGSMRASMQNLGQASQKTAKPQDRAGALEKTTEAQRQASDELSDAIKKMEDIGSLNATIDQIQKMLEAQRAITEQTRDIAARNAGKTAEQMNKEDREKLGKLADEQQNLSEQSRQMTERLGKTADQLNKADPASAEAMRKAQQQAQSQRVSPSQQQAAQQMRQNKQSDTKQSQQQAEVGLQMMLNELREAQKQKLAELQRKLAELQQQIEILIRRQSGHNLDNLTLQGKEQLEKQKELVEQLRTAAARKPTDPKPDVGRLLNGQGQTERNARDIAKKAADVENGAEPAAKVTRAATLMERAAVNLKDKKLVEAYEPPQLDALGALTEAKRMIDEAKNKADDEADKQTREQIRTIYERVKTAEQALADKTAAIEGRRGANGQLARADAGQLAGLVTEQQKLADELKGVSERLASLESIVYVWANQQVIDAMGDVKSSLGQGKTASPVQRQEAQIVADLQAMIDNLKTSPKSQRFENGGGGGGGGGGGKTPLPSEAELRLMKQLQTTINANTKQTDDKVKANKGANDETNESLVGLGRRQSSIRKLLGELASKASGGKEDIGEEPKDSKPLPEEATIDQIEDQELQQELLTGNAGANEKEANVRRVADRMARVRQRLELDRDGGTVTQVIEKRILDDFDLLIEEARQQQSSSKSSGKGQQPETQQEAQQEQQQAQNSGKQQNPTGAQAAQQSTPGGNTGEHNVSGKDIAETAEEWGKISARLRGPVLESRDETVIERYRRLVEDYTQAVSTEASGSGNTNATPGQGGGR